MGAGRNVGRSPGWPTEAQLDQWDGRLPEASQDPITTGAPTHEWADFDPRTVDGEGAAFRFTASGSSGQYDIVDGSMAVEVGDDEATIQAAWDGGLGELFPAAVEGDWSDWTVTLTAHGTLSPVLVNAMLTIDDQNLVGGSAAVEQTAEGRYDGLVRPYGSTVVYVEGAESVRTFERIPQGTFDDPIPVWVPVLHGARKMIGLGGSGVEDYTVTADTAGCLLVWLNTDGSNLYLPSTVPVGLEFVVCARGSSLNIAAAPGDPGEPEWNLPDGMTSEPQDGGRVTFTKITTNEWVISGDLVPAA